MRLLPAGVDRALEPDSTAPRVVHCKRNSYDVYIGRPSLWGNPFEIGKDGTREEVIEKYRDSIDNNMRLLIKSTLQGKVLGCWCAPKGCHGDILLEIANE